MEGFEAHHRLRDPLDKAMILLKDIVQIFDLENVYLRALAREFQDDVNRLKPRKVGAAFVDDNTIRHAVTVDHLFEKRRAAGRFRRFDSMNRRSAQRNPTYARSDQRRGKDRCIGPEP